MTTKRSRAGRPGTRRTAALALALAAALSGCTAAGSASGSDSERAEVLAAQLNANLAAVGLPGLDTETATILYGTDGGVSCENVGELQHELSLSQFGNNSGNLRRVVLDQSVVLYDIAVVATYCPDKGGSLVDVLGELDTEDTVPRP